MIMMESIVILLLALLPTTAWGYIDSDGECALSLFVPFTVDGKGTGSMSKSKTNSGFSHMAGALMAMDHFNSRNASVVPELKDLNNCNVRFDTNQSIFLDTGSVTHQAAKSFVREGQGEACAIVGPYNDVPARDLSILAIAHEIPNVAYRVFDPLVVTSHHSPYTLSVFPGILDSSRMLVDFLVQKERTDFVAIFYAWTAMGIYRKEALAAVLTGYSMSWTSSAFLVDLKVPPPVEDGLDALTGLRRIKDSGYRTIILSMENVFNEIQSIADAAEALEMNRGDYFFVVQNLFEATVLQSNNTNVTKLLAGSATVLPSSNSVLNNTTTDPFALAWQSQGKEQVDRLNAANPIVEGQPGYVLAQDDYFQSVSIEYGTHWIYDAVMSLGIGACRAAKQPTTNGTIISSQSHFDSVRNVSFTGATGEMAFGGMGPGKDDGSRLSSTLSWVAANLMPPNPDASADERMPYTYTDIIKAGAETGSPWQRLATFYFRDGRTVPPDLLRDTPEQNYLTSGLRITGFVLLGIVWMFALAAIIFVILRREHRVVKASQPELLCLLIFGAFLEASAIIPLSFDESYGWTEEQLGHGCVAITWLLPLGHIITYAALFTKLWRVQKVLQFSRRKVEVKHVAGPMLVLVLAALLILSLWTALDPLHWHRQEINELTGESFGNCSGKTSSAFMIPLLIVILIPTCLTLFMAWKTKDIDEAYSESKWTFMLVFSHLEVIVFAVPVIILLRDVSTDGRYLGFVIIIWSLPMSTLTLIMGPKFLAYWQLEYGKSDGQRSKRGESVGVKVSGLRESTLPPSTNPIPYHSSDRGSQPGSSALPPPSTEGSRRNSSQPNLPTIIDSTDVSQSLGTKEVST